MGWRAGKCARELRPLPSQETGGKEAAAGGWTFIVSYGSVELRSTRKQPDVKQTSVGGMRLHPYDEEL